MDSNAKLSEEVFLMENREVNCSSYGFFDGPRRLSNSRSVDEDQGVARPAAAVATPTVGDGGGAAYCTLCGKNFSSMKALYGHMRCHPERKGAVVARTASVPAADHRAAGSSGQCSAAAALPPVQLPVGAWSKTAKRGRKRARAYDSEALDDHGDASDGVEISRGRDDHDSSMEEEEDSDCSVQAAARILMLLRHDTWPSATATVEYDCHVPGEAYVASISTGSGTSDLDGHGPGRGDSSTTVQEEAEDTVAGSPTQELIRKKTTPTGPAGIITPTATTGTGLDGKAQHRCSTCNKLFPSHQALGGHMASHRKPSKSGTTTPEADSENSVDDKGPSSKGSAGSSSSPEQIQLRGVLIRSPKAAAAPSGAVEHRCNLCGKVFPTGQALGGHKRKHWDGPRNPINRAASAMEKSSTATATATATAITTTTTTIGAGAPSSGGVIRKLEIDLNEPAASEEEDGGSW